VSGRWEAVERDAQRIVADIRTGRRSTFAHPDTSQAGSYFQDVFTRAKQILSGDTTPCYGSEGVE